MIDQGVEIDVIVPQSIIHNIIWHEQFMPYKNIYKTSHGNEYTVFRPLYLSFGNRNGFYRAIANYTKRKALLKTIVKKKYDAIYIHFWENSVFVSEFCQKTETPLFIACGEGDDALEDMVQDISHETKKALAETVKGVICVSSENKRKCLAYGLSTDNNTIVLPNCVNTSLFKPQDSSSLRRNLGIGDDDFVVSFVGSFVHRKGARRLSAAIASLNDPHIKSIFVGKPLGADVEEPDCDGIVYKGMLSHDDISRYLNASDVFVLPTLKEGCSNAIVEALACGVPVISSERPFNSDILNDDNSIRVDPENVSMIADAIHRLKHDNVLYNRIKKFALLHSRDYSIENRARQIIAFIEERICH